MATSRVLSPREKAQQAGRNKPTSTPNQPQASPNSRNTKPTGPQPDPRSSIDSFLVNMDGDGDSWTQDGSKHFKGMLGAPALSNFYKVSINLSSTSNPQQPLSTWVTNAGVWKHPAGPTRFDFLCCETLIPGTALDVFSELGSYQGIEEFFPGRRIYTDISLSFYVSADYLILKLFQEWINFINPISGTNSGMMLKPNPSGYDSLSNDRNYYHRYRYPDTYKTIISINKFERNLEVVGGGYNNPNSITYKFIDAFPVNISSLPLSYDSAQILKVTVDFKYSRYLITSHVDDGGSLPDQFRQRPAGPDGSVGYSNFKAGSATSPYLSNKTFNVPGLPDPQQLGSTDYWNTATTVNYNGFAIGK